MDKLTKTAKRLDTFIKVLQKIITTCMIVVICVLGVLTIANIINPDTVIANGFYSVDIGSVTVNLTDGYSPEDNNMVLAYAWIGSGLGIIAAIAVYYALGQVRKILQPMAEGNPFHPTVSVNVRRVAYMSLVLGVVGNIASFIKSLTAVTLIDHLKLFEYAKEGTIQSITTNYSMDFTFVVVFFILILMSYIFRYGEELQQQVDETL